MQLLRYSVVEFDPDKPWVVLAQQHGLTVRLPDEASFAAWAAEQRPPSRYRAQLDAGEPPPWPRS
jgi:hypothetical protein